MAIDPNHTEFDPLAVENVGVTLAIELMQRPASVFPPPDTFHGPGVYALYYSGPVTAYAPLVKFDAGRSAFPVYVGQAARQNAKQGFSPRPSTGRELYDRIRNHYKSVTQASNLDVKDFRVRYLVLKSAYISLAESVLITTFRPPWNGMGFGSNPTGTPRMSGKASQWDALHPGRAGRPGGDAAAAAAAQTTIQERVAGLQIQHEDPTIRRMLARIMKFV